MKRLWVAPLLFGFSAVVAGTGCGSNPVILLAYLLNNDDPKMPAECPLTPRPKHEKEEVRVVVLTSRVPGLPPDLMGIDGLLAAEFIPLLQKRCDENKEKVSVKKSSLIDTYKKENPEWRSESPYDIGKKLNADYVIDIEVRDIGIVMPGSLQQFLKGKAKIGISVFDLSKSTKEPVHNPPEVNFDYPETGEVSVHDVPYSTFRQRFIKHIGQKLVLQFTAHTSNQKVPVD